MHRYTHVFFYTVNYPAPSLSALSSHPSSCLHPAPWDNSLPLRAGRQAGRQRRGQPWICSACYLMSVGMSPWACLLVPASQASIHVESAQSIKQLADSSAPRFSLSLSLFFPSQLLCHYLSSISTICASPCLFMITNKREAQVSFCRYASPPLPTSLT